MADKRVTIDTGVRATRPRLPAGQQDTVYAACLGDIQMILMDVKDDPAEMAAALRAIDARLNRMIFESVPLGSDRCRTSSVGCLAPPRGLRA